MNQHFKSKYDQMRENGSATASKSDDENHGDTKPVRNICFVSEDGTQQFLNYGYLISGTLDASKESILLYFTSHEVQMMGVKLDIVFQGLMANRIEFLYAKGSRYLPLNSDEDSCLRTINIVKTD